MRIIALSDTHAEHRNIPYIPDGDVFVFAGDFLYYGDESCLKDFYFWFKSLPHEYKVIVGGNHDWYLYHAPSRCKEFEDAIYLEDNSIVIKDLKFYGSPWVPELTGIGSFSRGRGTDIWEKWQFIPDDTNVLITHAAPFGIGDKVANSGSHVGCKDLIGRVEEIGPKVHIFGHVHASGGISKQCKSTFFANVAYTKNFNCPTIIDI